MNKRLKRFLRNSAFGAKGQRRARATDKGFFKLWAKSSNPKTTPEPLPSVEVLLNEIGKRMPWACVVGHSILREGYGFRAEVVLRFFFPLPGTGDDLMNLFLDVGFNEVVIASGLVSSGDNPVEEWEFTVSGLHKPEDRE